MFQWLIRITELIDRYNRVISKTGIRFSPDTRMPVVFRGETKMKDNHIFPFLWMRGEEEAVLREELEKIYEAGIRSVCLEARPHPDYAGDGWWHDVDIVIDEAKKRGMTIWILDDAHFPTGMANNGMVNSAITRMLATVRNLSYIGM